jgi:hypothetical protein
VASCVTDISCYGCFSDILYVMCLLRNYRYKQLLTFGRYEHNLVLEEIKITLNSGDAYLIAI